MVIIRQCLKDAIVLLLSDGVDPGTEFVCCEYRFTLLDPDHLRVEARGEIEDWDLSLPFESQ